MDCRIASNCCCCAIRWLKNRIRDLENKVNSLSVQKAPIEEMYIQEVYPYSTPSADCKEGYNLRNLNTVEYNGIEGASLSGNDITLPAGTYSISAHGETTKADTFTSVLTLTDSPTTKVLLQGLNTDSTNSGTTAVMQGVITLTETTVIRMVHYSSSTVANGFGTPVSRDTPEIYADIKIIKIG